MVDRAGFIRSRGPIRVAIGLVLLSCIVQAPQAAAQSAIDVILTYVEGQPIPGQVAYEVTAYVSVLDGAGDPIRDLRPEDFEIYEDSRRVEMASLGTLADASLSLILALDTSGSMVGAKIEAARMAAVEFIESLRTRDHVAVMSFDDDVNLHVDLSVDHEASLAELALLDAVPGAGTCLYDATLSAVQMAATVQVGRRLVVVLTDGVDETGVGGQPCSSSTIDDVIDLASDANTRVPIYTLGVGTRIDEQALRRLAERTGGRYLRAPSAAEVSGLFASVAEQLSGEYALRFTSTSAPGAHTLVVAVERGGLQDQDARSFLLPALPPMVTVLRPAEGEQVFGESSVVVSVSGQGAVVSSVVFEIDGVVVATDESAPYEVTIDFGRYAGSSLELSVTALGMSGDALAESSRTVLVDAEASEAVEAASTEPPPEIAAPPEEETSEGAARTGTSLLGWAFVLAVLGTLGLGAYFLTRRRRAQVVPAPVWGVGTSRPKAEDATYDELLIAQPSAGLVLATLEVVHSDEGAMIGRRIDIDKAVVTIGRSATCDIVLPDRPVSRQHAELSCGPAGTKLRELETVDEYGRRNRPTYGTFVNEVRVGLDPVSLTSGDEIRLGSRTRLRLTLPQQERGGEQATWDEIPAYDRTMDMPPSDEASDGTREMPSDPNQTQEM